jgi:hypothetical protein
LTIARSIFAHSALGAASIHLAAVVQSIPSLASAASQTSTLAGLGGARLCHSQAVNARDIR